MATSQDELRVQLPVPIEVAPQMAREGGQYLADLFHEVLNGAHALQPAASGEGRRPARPDGTPMRRARLMAAAPLLALAVVALLAFAVFVAVAFATLVALVLAAFVVTRGGRRGPRPPRRLRA